MTKPPGMASAVLVYTCYSSVVMQSAPFPVQRIIYVVACAEADLVFPTPLATGFGAGMWGPCHFLCLWVDTG